MKIEVKLADKNNGFIIKNMYPLYLHDLSGIHGVLPNNYGIFEEEDDVKTLEEQYDLQQLWFEETKVLFPYLIIVDNKPAGFCLVGSGKYVPKDVDYYIYETFLLSVYRGKNISYEAIKMIFSKHKGKWMLYTNATDNNKRAQTFWHKTVGSYTNNNYTLSEMVVDRQPKVVFKFEN